MTRSPAVDNGLGNGMHILFLHDEIPDGAPIDAADALVQAEFLNRVLREMGHACTRMAFTSDTVAMRTAIERHRPDIVFNLVESVGGAGRQIHLAPALLDAMGLPYTGARTNAMKMTSGKVLTKARLRESGIATPDWLALNLPVPSQGISLPHASPHPRAMPQRFIIKSVWEDASIGLDDSSIIETSEPLELQAEIVRRQPRLGGEAFAEAFIEGREFNISLLTAGPNPDAVDVLPAAEIEFVGYTAEKPRIVGYAAKWDVNSFEYANTRRRFDFDEADAALLRTLRTIARQCWSLFNLRGYARVDFRVDESGRPWVLEINANPCLSPDAGFMAAVAQAGITDHDAIKRILDDALVK